MAQTSTKFAAVGHCIYCGSTEPPLSNEHIIPFALNGALILPQATCTACANITKKFEQTVARSIYGHYRVKKGFRTRRKNERPKVLPLYTVAIDGKQTKIDLPVRDYPNVYLAVDAPPPGILIGLEPTSRNPELKLSLKADPVELSRTIDMMSLQKILMRHVFDWGAFFRQLAKIGHCYAFACTRGREYQPFLPDIILGKSDHLSHYIGGSGTTADTLVAKSELSLGIICKPTGDYLVAGIQILGIGTLYPYQVVVGKIPNLEAFISATLDTRDTP